MRRILAIDPGLSGGIAHFANNRVVLEPMPDTDGDVREVMINYLSQSDVVYIEKVGGYIGGKGAPGSAMFNFGRNVGFLHGLIASMMVRWCRPMSSACVCNHSMMRVRADCLSPRVLGRFHRDSRSVRTISIFITTARWG